MKKCTLALIIVALTGVFGITAQSYKDGVYFAQAKDYAKSGWKYQLVLEVKAGKITRVEWNGTNNIGVADKKTYSKSGLYGMEKSAKQGPWHEQGARVEAFLLKNQKIDSIPVSDKFTTDAISGATVKVNEFVDLFKEAIASKPITKGIYKKDGWYFAEGTADAKTGWKDNVLITVVNGTIVDAVWNGLNIDTTKKSKLVESLAGTYGMEKSAKQGAWHLQSASAIAYLLKMQDPAKIPLKDGKTDAISGATLTVGGFFDLVTKALSAAK